ncbi:interference hedgehog-like isoform X3 [Pseudomyrmex gracilis]|nr:interference hedgehog-like isoform X3 [Pseudomyrmex gracilis]
MTSILSLCGIVVVLFCGPIAGSHVTGEKKSSLAMFFTRQPQPLAAPLDDTVNFECSLNIGARRFAWYHRPLVSKKWKRLAYLPGGKTSQYVVNFDNKSRAGDYRCVAFYGERTPGLASDPARLTLAEIEKFSDKNDVLIQVAQGNTVPITCPVPHSEPRALVSFYKDNKLIKDVNLVNGKTLVIKNATIADSGSYHCKANNYILMQVSEANHKTILTVHANTTYQPLSFVKQPQTEYTVLRGKNVTLECYGAGYPVPRVFWSRLGSTLPLKSVVTSEGLTIVHVQPSDRGEYDCQLNNDYHRIKTMIILKVVEPPRVINQPEESMFFEGGELELFCGVTGEPEPTIEWLINGETLKRSKTQIIRGSTLFISEVEKKHAGIVQCVASNEYGSHSGYSILKVTPKQHIIGTTESQPNTTAEINASIGKHTRGGGGIRRTDKQKKGTVEMIPPNQPYVTRLSDTSVMVRWTVKENEGLAIQFFKVQYRELGSKANKQTDEQTSKQSKWMTANSEIPSHVRSFEVTDLQSNHTYKFRIAAVYSNNDNKLSPNSVPFHLHKNIESKKMPIPLLTNTEAIGPHEVLLIWQNNDKSTKIDGFYIYHRASTSAGDYVKTTVEGEDAYNTTISHLQADTTYEFKIQSFSVNAASEFSQILRQKTKKISDSEVDLETEQEVAENKLKPGESNETVNVTFIIVGVATLSLLLLGGLGIMCRRARHKQEGQESQNEERVTSKTITNGRVMNGGVTDSKINITSNPLAGLDASDDIMQPKVSI